jgi:hypothetical protein
MFLDAFGLQSRFAKIMNNLGVVHIPPPELVGTIRSFELAYGISTSVTKMAKVGLLISKP